MVKTKKTQGRDSSDCGGRRNRTLESDGRFRRSTAEIIAGIWPLAILPALVVTYSLWQVFVMRNGLPERIALLAGFATAFLLNSLFTIWFYKEDKRLAEQKLRRVPEFHLHFWELFCGWPGALYAQRKYRHKWKKVSYMIFFWFYVILNLALATCLVFPDTAWPVAEEGFRLLRGISDGGA